MVRKQCTRCRKMSYSLSAHGRWICPSCGEDLSEAPVLVRDRSTADILPLTAEEASVRMLN